MSDLISRKAAIKMICEGGYMTAALAKVEALPSIDAEPVRHGKWVYDPNANDWGIGGYICSECHVKNNNLPSSNVANPMIFVGTKYCPNCGAKMRLEDAK